MNIENKKINRDSPAVHQLVIKSHKGHTLYKLQNGVVTKLREEEIIRGGVTLSTFGGGKLIPTYHKKINAEINTQYITALNIKNAIKHFLKNGHHVNRGNIDWKSVRAGYEKFTDYQSEEEVYMSIDPSLMKIFDKYEIEHPTINWGRN